MRYRHRISATTLMCAALLTAPHARAQDEAPWLSDRGPGIPTSLFGSYIEKGQLLFYPFYEFTLNTSEEYEPKEFGVRNATNSSREFQQPSSMRGIVGTTRAQTASSMP